MTEDEKYMKMALKVTAIEWLRRMENGYLISGGEIVNCTSGDWSIVLNR